MNKNPLYENAAIIAPKALWGRYLDYRASYPDADFKLYSLQEAIDLFAYIYDDRALVHLIKKGYGYNLSKEMLKAIAYIDLGKEYASNKLMKLKEEARELIEAGLLYKFPHPEKVLKDRNILISGYKGIGELTHLWRELPNISVSFDAPKAQKDVAQLKKFKDLYQEVRLTCNLMAKLIYDGVDPNDIFIYNCQGPYVPAFKLFAPSYGLDIAFDAETKLSDLSMSSFFLSAIKGGKTLEEAMKETADLFGEDPNFTSFSILAQRFYLGGQDIDRQIEIYKAALADESAERAKPLKAIRLLNEPYAKEGSHVFFVGFDSKSAPILHRDDDYLFDEEKKEIGMPTSSMLNVRDNEALKELVFSDEIESISYKKTFGSEESFPSPWLKKYSFEVLEDPELPFDFSIEGLSFLHASLEDTYAKLGHDHKARKSLKRFDQDYASYDHKGSGTIHINRAEGKRHYSYSSLDNYFKCPYSYYLSHVLRIDDSESTFNAEIGTIFHYVLSHIYDEGFDFESDWAKAVDSIRTADNPFSNKEKVLLLRLKSMCREVLDFILEQESHCVNPKAYTEREFLLDVNDEVAIKGFIDKFLLTGHNQENISIIDYKTGSTKFDPKLVDNGLSLQLPVYAYILSKADEFKAKKLLGLFIEHILPSKLDSGDAQSKIDETAKSYKLDGQYRPDIEALSSFSPDTLGANYIGGLSINKDGGLKSSSSQVGEDVFHSYIKTVEEKILQADEAIGEGKFPISPKKVKNGRKPCEYCCFADVCFADEGDVIYVEGGEEDENE